MCKKSFRKTKYFLGELFFWEQKSVEKIYFTRAGKNILHYKWFFLERILRKKNFLPEKWRVDCVSDDLSKKFMFWEKSSFFRPRGGRRIFFAQKKFRLLFPGREGQNFFSLWEKIYFIPSIENDRLSEGGIIFLWAPEKKNKNYFTPPPRREKNSSLQMIFLWAGRILLLAEKWKVNCVSEDLAKTFMFSTEAVRRIFLRKNNSVFLSPGEEQNFCLLR